MKRCVRQQQRNEIMQHFFISVNPLFLLPFDFLVFQLRFKLKRIVVLGLHYFLFHPSISAGGE